MADRLTGRELLAIKARTGRAGRGLHQSLKQTEADRLALLREMVYLRAERDALKAAIDAATEVDHAHIKEFHPTRIRVTDCAGCRIGLMLSKLTPASAPESPATDGDGS